MHLTIRRVKKNRSKLTSIEMKNFRRTAKYNLLDHKRNDENFGTVESRTISGETKEKQIKLATICIKNAQQQDAKNKAELQTKWTKKAWMTLEENIR
jgi:CRISPR/Cas system CMR-associated protein Cmr3 (group 5 of RAMP superfamily)